MPAKKQKRVYTKMANTQKNGCKLSDIAKACGISKGAASLALSGSPKISDATKRRVRRAAQEMGYKRIPVVSRVMSSIKSGAQGGFLETIVLINANKDRNAAKKYRVFEKYTAGLLAEAREIGYAVYTVWLHDKLLTPEKLRGALYSRGIRGGVIIGHTDDTFLPEKFAEIWRDFKFVSAGLRTFSPALDFVSADKFLIARQAAERIIKMGFRRPAMAIDAHIDDIVEGRFSGGYMRALLDIPPADRIPPFTRVAEAKANPQIFFDWLARAKPDAVFSVSTDASEWLASEGVLKKISERAKFISAEEIGAAADENSELIGRFAARKLFEILNAPSKLKDIAAATATIIPPDWRGQQK